MLVPLHGFLKGDTLGLLVLVHDTDSIEQVAKTLIEAAAVRVAPAPRGRVFRGSEELSPGETVAGVGLGALERVDVIPEWPDDIS